MEALSQPLPRNVGPAGRWTSVIAGGALAAYGLMREKKQPLVVLAGAALVARGASVYCPITQALRLGGALDDTRQALGGSRGIKLQETVTIRSTAEQMYALWRPLRELPRLMPHIQRVNVIDARRSHWIVRGPVGVLIGWDAEIINDVKPAIIEWRSLPNSDVASAGSVVFRERVDDGDTVTDVTVTLQYEPLGGKAGAWLAWLTGSSPASMLRDDLQRLKAQFETRDLPVADRMR